MKEIFRDIPGYESIYQVSNFGEVRSLRYNRIRILKYRINIHGYYIVDLTHYKNPKTWQIHQLVAMAFLNHKPCGYNLVVNHINLNKLYNNISNLEIISQRQNTNKKHMNSYSSVLGVGYNKVINRLQVKIVINKKQIHLGYFNLNDENIGGIYYNIALENIHLYNGNTIEFREMIKKKFSESVINKGR